MTIATMMMIMIMVMVMVMVITVMTTMLMMREICCDAQTLWSSKAVGAVLSPF